jgi:hypothetical protein
VFSIGGFKRSTAHPFTPSHSGWPGPRRREGSFDPTPPLNHGALWPEATPAATAVAASASRSCDVARLRGAFTAPRAGSASYGYESVSGLEGPHHRSREPAKVQRPVPICRPRAKKARPSGSAEPSWGNDVHCGRGQITGFPGRFDGSGTYGDGSYSGQSTNAATVSIDPDLLRCAGGGGHTRSEEQPRAKQNLPARAVVSQRKLMPSAAGSATWPRR